MTTVPAPPMQTTIRVAPPAATPGGSGVIVSPPPLVQGPAPVPPVTLPQPMPPQMPPGYPYPGGYGYPDPYAGSAPYDPYGYGGYYPPTPPSYGYGYGYGYPGSYGGGFMGFLGSLLGNGPLDGDLSPEEEYALRRFYHVLMHQR